MVPAWTKFTLPWIWYDEAKTHWNEWARYDLSPEEKRTWFKLIPYLKWGQSTNKINCYQIRKDANKFNTQGWAHVTFARIMWGINKYLKIAAGGLATPLLWGHGKRTQSLWESRKTEATLPAARHVNLDRISLQHLPRNLIPI